MSTPIYQRALGTDYARLQPELQEYFSLTPGSGHYGVGEGVFEVVGCRQKWLRPLLRLASGEESFFPEYGEGIRFRIENHAHLDPFGRSSLTARREIFFPGTTRVFHDTTSFDDSGSRHGLVDYVGRYRRLVTDLNLGVTAGGRLRGVSEASRLFLGPLRIPLPGRPRCQGLRRAVVGAGGGPGREAPDPGEGDPAAARAGPGLCRAFRLPAGTVSRRRGGPGLPSGPRQAGPLGRPQLTVPRAGPASRASRARAG